MKKQLKIIAFVVAILIIAGTLAGCAQTATTKAYGPGPNGETIKGNINKKGEKIYHMPGQKYYDMTNPEEWFFTEEDAQRAGYRKSKA